jgi:hypothetical protein
MYSGLYPWQSAPHDWALCWDMLTRRTKSRITKTLDGNYPQNFPQFLGAPAQPGPGNKSLLVKTPSSQDVWALTRGYITVLRSSHLHCSSLNPTQKTPIYSKRWVIATVSSLSPLSPNRSMSCAPAEENNVQDTFSSGTRIQHILTIMHLPFDTTSRTSLNGLKTWCSLRYLCVPFSSFFIL